MADAIYSLSPEACDISSPLAALADEKAIRQFPTRNSAVSTWGKQISEGYEFAKALTADAISSASRKTRQISDDVRARTVRLKNEQPLQFLAGLAGIALLAGVATRVWRSSQYE